MKQLLFGLTCLLALTGPAADEALVWPFPDRMSAFVWRNWETVPKAQLAAATGATEADIDRIAAELGLGSQGTVDPRWRTVGRHTVVRRNWNLVPKSQWSRFVEPAGRAFSNSTESTDYEKLHFGGGSYPELSELKYDAAEAKKHAPARRRLAALAETTGCAAAGRGWKPFAFMEDGERRAESGERRAESGERRFRYRMNCYPYHGEWTDGLLEKNAAVGVNAIWTQADFASVVKDAKYPELGKDADRYYAEWNDLVVRAAKYGIKVFLFFNDPKQQSAAFFEKGGREAIRGMPNKDGSCFSLCTSTPEVQRWLEDGMASVFAAVPGLGGFVTITASEARTNCASRRSERGKCARCKERPAGAVFAGVHAAMSRGMRRSAPEALAICWDWGWNEDEATEAIPLLPKGDALLVMSEKGLETVTGGVTNEVREYAMSRIGPSGRALREWALAKRCGLKPIAKVQVGASWEFSSVPEIPVRELVAEHIGRVARTEVDGIAVSWTVGSYPGLNMQIACDWPVCPAMPDTRSASEAFRRYPYNGGTLYCGNQHLGPGNPLYPAPTGKLATMTGIPYDNLDRWRGNIGTNDWIAGMEAVADGTDGLTSLHFRSAAEQARFTVARDAGDQEAMKRAAFREKENAMAAFAFLEADSRNAFEVSNSYYYTPQDLREKVIGCSLIVEPPTVWPEKTLEFPGSGCASFATDGRVLYAVSAWTRDKGAVVFDVSDPANMRFAADLPARGYSTSRPILVGERAYQSLWYGVARVNLKDPAHPVLEELMDYDWPVHSADSIVRDGNELRFVSRKGVRVYDVSDPSRPAQFLRTDPPGGKIVKETSNPPVRIGDIEFRYDRARSSFQSARIVGKERTPLCERFLLHSLSTLAVVGKTAYVSAATASTTGVLTLDLTKQGLVDFGTNAVFRPAPAKGTQNFTMLMQSVGDIAALDDGSLLADDAVVRVGAGGRLEPLGEREKPVCNWSKDGSCIALAQSDRLRVLDISDPTAVRERARVLFPLKDHVTGVALKGDRLWVVVNEKPASKLNHRNAFLGYVPPQSTCIRYRLVGRAESGGRRADLVVEASNAVPSSVSCELLSDGVLCLAGHDGLSLVDAETLATIRRTRELAVGPAYRIRRCGERVYFTDAAVGVKELDVADPQRPYVVRTFRRSRGSNPSYDGFTVSDGRLYALSHSSLDVYDLGAEGGERRAEGGPSPRFALNFGAVERGVAKLPDGYEAVAFGEGGLYIRKDGRYVSELPATPDGKCAVAAFDVAADGSRLTVTDCEHGEKVYVDAADPQWPVIIGREKIDGE